ncbi:MAG: hypothetical protein OXH75_11160 [Acidobacteria bacterium]|nr:hypothetical protein [Acidobacteriota bacterium]
MRISDAADDMYLVPPVGGGDVSAALSLVTQGDHRIEPGGASRGPDARRHRYGAEEDATP